MNKKDSETKASVLELLNKALIELASIPEAEIDHEDFGYDDRPRLKRPKDKNGDYDDDFDLELNAMKMVIKKLIGGSSEEMMLQYYNSNC